MESTNKKTIWNYAGTAGLLLGLISTASMFLGQVASTMTESSSALGLLLGMILWCAETGGCIYLMYFFMKKLAEDPSVDNSKTFKMGVATAFFSALVYSAASFANIAYISADLYTEQMQMVIQQMGSVMDSNTRSMFNKMMENLPQITFFSNLIYCFLFGTVASLIISRMVPGKDPFADYKPKEE